MCFLSNNAIKFLLYEFSFIYFFIIYSNISRAYRSGEEDELDDFFVFERRSEQWEFKFDDNGDKAIELFFMLFS